MGWFNFGTKEDEKLLTYWPGGRVLNIRITYHPEKDIFEYRGNYGSKASFKGSEIVQLEVNPISHDRSIVLIKGENSCLGTLDLLPNRVCENLRVWIESRGAISYDFEEQEKLKTQSISQQTVPGTETLEKAQPPTDHFQSLKQLKELVDMGIITEEEFQQKKADILKKI